jgi:hypothetical protein
MKVKGIAWIVMMKYFSEHHTPKDIEKLKAALDQESRELFESKYVLPFSFVDYGTFLKIQLTADKVIGRGDFELVKQLNYYSARHDVHGVYKFIVSLLSPKTAFQALSKLLNQFYDKGKLHLENATSNGVTIIIEDAPDIPLYHDIEQGAYVEEIVRMAGAKDIKFTHTQCMARGDVRCRWEVTWK